MTGCQWFYLSPLDFYGELDDCHVENCMFYLKKEQNCVFIALVNKLEKLESIPREDKRKLKRKEHDCCFFLSGIGFEVCLNKDCIFYLKKEDECCLSSILKCLNYKNIAKYL